MDTILRSKVIAIVDDDQSMRLGIASLLRSFGWVVRAYDSGAAFLSELDRLEICLLIADVQMPDLDGIALVKEVATRQLAIPTVFVTAYATQDVVNRCRRIGGAGVFSKPLDEAKLLVRVEQIVGPSSF
ncbi:response regulator transcription factor [Paraburkholderia sp. BR10937]|uniref:response regulator transcription factor n=1 Tax=Paraburkholderia sp. BR10937 TaxID=3236994 RepID=UPI0034D22F35